MGWAEIRRGQFSASHLTCSAISCTGGAVQADQVGFQRVNDRGCRRNIRPDQQRAGGFYRNLHKNGQCCSGLGAGALDAVDSGLDLQRVLTGFDQDRIHSTFDQAAGLLGQGLFQRVVIDIAQRGQLGARPHGAHHIAVAAIGKAVRRLTRQKGGGTVDFARARSARTRPA